MTTNKGTFDINNFIISKKIIKLNPIKYKGWAKKLRLNVEQLDTEIGYVKDEMRRSWIKQLLMDRFGVYGAVPFKRGSNLT